MFKLAFYEYFADTRSYYREHRWMKLLTLALTVSMLLLQNYGMVLYSLIMFTSSDSEIGQHYPQIFSYVPLDEKQIKRYILNRTFMSGLLMSALLFLLACGCALIFDSVQNLLNFWLPFWIAMVLFNEKRTFYQIYKSLNLSAYYSGMTIFGRIFNRMIRIVDFITFAILFIYLFPTISSMQESPPNRPIYIIGGSIIYQCLSLIYFVFHVRKSMNRLKLPELIEI